MCVGGGGMRVADLCKRRPRRGRDVPAAAAEVDKERRSVERQNGPMRPSGLDVGHLQQGLGRKVQKKREIIIVFG